MIWGPCHEKVRKPLKFIQYFWMDAGSWYTLKAFWFVIEIWIRKSWDG